MKCNVLKEHILLKEYSIYLSSQCRLCGIKISGDSQKKCTRNLNYSLFVNEISDLWGYSTGFKPFVNFLFNFCGSPIHILGVSKKCI